MATLDPSPIRLPLDIAAAREVVDAGLGVVDRLLRGATADERVGAFVAALRTLHLDIAAAEFDDRLPARPPRNGGES